MEYCNTWCAKSSSRAGFRREVSAISISEPADSSPDALDWDDPAGDAGDCGRLLCGTLDRDYRDVLTLRMDGLKYGEIARRMGVNENTVATWVSRGIRELGRRIRKRMDGRHE